VFWVISVYFNIRNTLGKFGTFLLGHPVYCRVEESKLMEGVEFILKERGYINFIEYIT
jgi:hypothetical protein